MIRALTLLIGITLLTACRSKHKQEATASSKSISSFHIEISEDKFEVFRDSGGTAIVTQNIKPNFRPYIHPILAPGTDVELTQFSPGHHKHQTGLFWGFTRVNGTGAEPEELNEWFYNPEKPAEIKKKIGRDFYHNPNGDYWQKVSSEVLKQEGEQVKWQTVYHMLDESKTPILKETQTWSLTMQDDKYLLNLDWEGEALTDIVVNEFNYGGLFLRMPWKEGVEGEVVNAARQRNEKAEGQRAMWVDVGMEVDGLEDWGHIAILDHKENQGFPQSWRVDGQLGVGPAVSRQGDWNIKKGTTKQFQNQIIAYTGELDDREMDHLWGEYVEDQGMYNTAALWKIAQQEGLEAKFLNPEEAVDAMTVKHGYKVNAYASEPMITQPMAFCWDDQGRMWIAENRDYESRGDGFSNSGDSRILILEDTNRDGVADTKKVFMEGLAFPSAIAVGHGGIYVGAPPNLLFIPNINDVADEENIEVLLTGWGIRDRHETINSLHWGPDGWLYGLEGYATPSKIRKPKGEGRIYKHRDAFPENLLEADGVYIDGGVWRYHPFKDRFEVVAHGFSNPWGIDYNSKGELFITACVIPHVFHIMQGGFYHRQGGQHVNPYVYEDIKTIVDHRHRSAHGGARIYQSDAFPEEQHGRLFMANIHDHAVLTDVLDTNGSGFTATHGEEFMAANNAQFVGFSMEVGPGGNVYVLDWHDADICGSSVLNKNTGRVYRIAPEESQATNWPGRYDDLNLRTDSELAELQRSKSNWHVQRARIILQYRASKRAVDNNAVSYLNDLLANDPNEDLRLRALWTLQVTRNLSEERLIDLLNDKDVYVRAWAIQFLVEDDQRSSIAIKRMKELAKNDRSPVVRRFLAGALQRINEEDRWGIAEKLVGRQEDANDVNIPLMLWFGIEPLIAKQPTMALNLAAESKIPSIRRKIARRLVDGGKMKELVAGIGEKSGAQLELLEGMLTGIEGNADVKATENWPKVYQSLSKDAELSRVADEIAQRFGNADLTQKSLATIRNADAETEEKIKSIRALAEQQNTELIWMISDLLQQSDLRLETIKAIASYNNQHLGQVLYDQYGTLSEIEKQEAILTLASRPRYGRILLDGLKSGEVPKEDIPAHAVLQLRAVLGNGFVEVWGPIDDVSRTVQKDYEKYSELLSEDAIANSSPTKGEEVYKKTCSACHIMHGEGGEIGPELTGSNRTNTTYLLSNILDPSGDVQDDYKLVVITTQGGRTYSGNIIGEDDRNLTLRVVGQEPIVISKSQIRTRDVSQKSMMPEGLLNNLTEQEVLDLVAYLKKD